MLASVPAVWGTYAPAVRYMYSLPLKVPGLVFSNLYYIVACLVMSVLLFVSQSRGGKKVGPEENAVTLRAGAELGGYLFLGNTVQVLGLQMTSSGRFALCPGDCFCRLQSQQSVGALIGGVGPRLPEGWVGNVWHT